MGQAARPGAGRPRALVRAVRSPRGDRPTPRERPARPAPPRRDRRDLGGARDPGAARRGHPARARRAARLGRAGPRHPAGDRDAAVHAHPVPRRGGLGARHPAAHRAAVRRAGDGARVPAARRRPARPSDRRGDRRRHPGGRARGLAGDGLAGGARRAVHGTAHHLPAHRPRPARRRRVGRRRRRHRPPRRARPRAARRRRATDHRLRGDRSVGVQDGRLDLQLVARLRAAELAAHGTGAAAGPHRPRRLLEGDEPHRVRRRPLDDRRRPVAAAHRCVGDPERGGPLAPGDPRDDPRAAHDAGHRRREHARDPQLAAGRARGRSRALRDDRRPAHERAGVRRGRVRPGAEPPRARGRADELSDLQPGLPEHGPADRGRRPDVDRRYCQLPGLALRAAHPLRPVGRRGAAGARPTALPPRPGGRDRPPWRTRATRARGRSRSG